MRLAAALNLAQGVAAGARDLAAFFGAVGWALGGYRRRRRCSSSAPCSPRSPSTRTPTARCSGCSAHASTRSPRTRSCARPSTPSRPSSAIVPPKLYLIPDGFPRALAAGRGPHGSALAFSTGLLGALTPAELEARARARARARAPPRRARADLRGDARGRARRALPDRRLVRAGAAGRPRPDRGGVRPPAALAQARAGCRPGGGGIAAAPATGSPTRSCASTAPATSSRSRRARRRSRSTPSIRSPRRGSPRSSSPTRRSSAGSRRYAGSPGRQRPHRHVAALAALLACQARSTPSRVKPPFSATRSDATLPGNVPSCIRGSASSSNAQRAERAHRARDVAAAAARRARPSSRARRLSAVQPERDRRGELAASRARRPRAAPLLAPRPSCSARAGAGVLLGVRRRNRRPARDLGVVAGGDDRRHVALRHGAADELVPAAGPAVELHRRILGGTRRRAALAALLK